jgi:D-sedoheptulose 7-phosphate isomerase
MNEEATDFLYPFIEADEHDVAGLLRDLEDSALQKMADSHALRDATLARCGDELARVGRAMADRFESGARLFAFGNGGSATDAQGAVALFVDPPEGRALPATSLVEDMAVITALANDVGFDLVFSRQIIAHARPLDIAVGFSTSGDSVDVLRALEESHRRGLMTVGLCGYEGGAMAQSPAIDHCCVVASHSVHRIQEVQSALVLATWSAVQEQLHCSSAS